MATTPSSLDSSSLARRLGELAGDERQVQVEFLLHLDEFDLRRAYLEAGFGSLWEYCRDALHLREGAAGRRINAMRVLRRFPGLAGAMRDGRLCLSTLSLLGQVLTEENADELVARAAHRSTAAVDQLVASLRPRPAPREGIRRLPGPAGTGRLLPEPATSSPQEVPAVSAAVGSPSDALLATPGLGSGPAASAEPMPLLEPPRPRTVEVRPLSEDRWSLRATIDRSFKADLETLSMLLSHKVRNGDVAAVLHEAIRCAIEKHGVRKGAVRPARKVAPKASPPTDPRAIPAELRRQVWERDGGRCAWTGPDGRLCGSRWQVEVDHVKAVARGGKATLANLRLACRQLPPAQPAPRRGGLRKGSHEEVPQGEGRGAQAPDGQFRYRQRRFTDGQGAGGVCHGMRPGALNLVDSLRPDLLVILAPGPSAGRWLRAPSSDGLQGA